MRAAWPLAMLVTRLWRRGPLTWSQALRGPIRVTAAAASDVGKVRERNEDYVLIVDLADPRPPIAPSALLTPEVPLLVVADGMGGAAAGEVASEMAAAAIAAHLGRAWRERRMRAAVDLHRAVLEAFAIANGDVYSYAARSTGLMGMGTTATVATIVGRELWVGHVGDSRAYLLRGGQAQQLTTDHSLAQHLVDAGALSDAAGAPTRNVLVRALGPCAEVAVDVWHGRVEPGDTLVLCCDGLWSAVADGEILAVAATAEDPRLACDALIQLANARGGDDNVSVLVARLDHGGRLS